jgi:hypothetical protein
VSSRTVFGEAPFAAPHDAKTAAESATNNTFDFI